MDDIIALGGNPTHTPVWIIGFRLFVAAALGAAIGLERELNKRPAGLRTHMLISVAACVFTVMTFEIYYEMVQLDATLAQLDPLRVIEAVTAGVAFLAAGAIIRSGLDIKGLTTGATMWMAGAIGVACGAGFLAVGVMGTVLVLIITFLIGLLERRFLEEDKTEPGDPERGGDASR